MVRKCFRFCVNGHPWLRSLAYAWSMMGFSLSKYDARVIASASVFFLSLWIYTSAAVGLSDSVRIILWESALGLRKLWVVWHKNTMRHSKKLTMPFFYGSILLKTFIFSNSALSPSLLIKWPMNSTLNAPNRSWLGWNVILLYAPVKTRLMSLDDGLHL